MGTALNLLILLIVPRCKSMKDINLMTLQARAPSCRGERIVCTERAN